MEAIIHENPIKKPFKKLEINYLNSDNIVANFRELLTKYKVQYNKLRHYQWFNLGSDCHELNKEFNDMYLIINNKINLINCRIYDFNQEPQMTIEDVLKNSSTKEQLSLVSMKEQLSIVRLLYQVNDILSDFGQLHDTMFKSSNTSLNITDNANEYLIAKFIQNLKERN